MKQKIVRLISLILCTVVFFSGCSSDLSQGTSQSNNNKPTDINGVHLRDRDYLYENQDNTEVVTMYLTVSEGNSGENTNHTWAEVNTYSAYYYDELGIDRYKVAGLLQVGDENGPKAGELGYNQSSPNCTVQIRGQSSSQNSQKNYKISIKDNKGQWREQSTIALNKHQGDGLRFRNKLAYDLITGVEQMMGLRTTFVHLYVKDNTSSGDGTFRDYGLYTQVEQLNKTALKAHGLDKNGHLYKINYCEFYRYADVIKLKDDPTYDEKAFEEILEIKGDDNHQKLINMLESVNDFSTPIDTTLEKYFDVENITYWMAFQILMGNIDTQSRNFYIYSPLNSQKWYILTWDNDGSLKRTEYSVLERTDNGGWETGVSNYWGNVLFQRCLKSEKFRKELDKAIEDLKGYLSEERLNGYASMYADVVKPFVYRMPDQMYAPLSAGEYDVVAKSIAGEVETNYNAYKESLKAPQPFFIGVPAKSGDKMSITWENSFDFGGESITYSFELARDVGFNEIIEKQENLVIPATEFDALGKGQYFVRVKATNKSGKSQYAFDYYITEMGKNYGIKCFYVDSAGKVVEEEYVEN